MKKIFSIAVIGFLIVAPIVMVAQGPPGNPGGGGSPGVPLDGGITTIIAAGIAFGIRQAKQKFKKTI